ncbi:MAG: dUTPase [Puniceicoccales bacterium]|nr:dUTPase [Puniceicoccales bacterium]
MDKLDKIFEMQTILNDRTGVHNFPDLGDGEKIKWILNYARAMQQEIAELVDSVPWKWWAKYQKFDEQNARVELIDLLHFIISIAQVLGMSADDLYDVYRKKHLVNMRRQESGYTVKDSSDTRDI